MQDTEFYRQRYLSQGYSVEDAAAMGGMTASATDYAAEEEAISKRAE